MLIPCLLGHQFESMSFAMFLSLSSCMGFCFDLPVSSALVASVTQNLMVVEPLLCHSLIVKGS